MIDMLSVFFDRTSLGRIVGSSTTSKPESDSVLFPSIMSMLSVNESLLFLLELVEFLNKFDCLDDEFQFGSGGGIGGAGTLLLFVAVDFIFFSLLGATYS